MVLDQTRERGRDRERERERERIRKIENNRELVKHKFVFRNKSLSQF